MIDPSVKSLCDEFDIIIVSKSSYPRPGETRAVASIRKMIEKRGMDHARIVMGTLAETSNNKASLEAECIGATSDLLLACRDYHEADPSKWFEAFDACPIGSLQRMVHQIRGFVPLRPALAGLIYERIDRAFGDRSIQPDLLDDRVIDQ